MAAPDRERLSVLLVEDDTDDYLITRDHLADQDRVRFDVEWAQSYDAARDAIEAGRFDVYLIDYRLGARTGLDLVRDCLWASDRAPVILLTGQGDYEVDLEATKLGVTDFLHKSRLDATLLERSIRYAVRHHRMLSELRSSRERYELAVHGANDGIWDWDLSARRMYFAERWKALLGLAGEEVGESPRDWLDRVHPDDLVALERSIDAHLQGRTPHFESEHRILHADGSWRWMLSRGVAVRDEEGFATRMAGSMSDVTDRKSAEERLVHDALHDGLTELPNRALFVDRLTLSLSRFTRRPGYRCAVLFLDLDRFKVVNDGFSHAVGDQLLVALAQRLSAALRVGDTVARLGGDEFTFLLEDVASEQEARDAALRLQRELEEPFSIEGREIVVTASIGISLSDPGLDPAEMMRNADIAMYDAKRSGQERIAVFDVSMHSRVMSQLKLETELRGAIEQGALRVFYQPIVDLPTGELAGFEALARWPAGQPAVGPERFIPIAEDCGLIGALGHHVIRKACATLAHWHARGLVGRHVTMSVNLSAGQLVEPTLTGVLTDALRNSSLPARALALEITESTIMHDPPRARAALDELEQLGLRAQIDDFGTGYSSLTFLHHFPGDTIKIDRSFVSSMHVDPGSEEIVRAIVSLAHNLSLRVVAEGVDDPAQVRMLRDLGCELAQGFLWSRPLDADELERAIADWDPQAFSASRSASA